MEDQEIRSVVKFFNLKGLTVKQMKDEFDIVLRDSSPSLKTIYKWNQRFRSGSTSTKDEPRSGRPTTVTIGNYVDAVESVVKEDRRLKLSEIANLTNISKERVHHILHNVLGMRKLCGRWVPRLLTDAQKKKRVKVSKDCLVQME
jgi:transposase